VRRARRAGNGWDSASCRHPARFDYPWRSNFQLTLGRYHDHRNRRLPDDLSRESTTQERPRFFFASRTEEDEKSPFFCSDRNKPLGNVANLGSPVDAAHELLVEEDVSEEPDGVPPHMQDRGGSSNLWSPLKLSAT
jgi:hypothetical protein